MAKNRRIPFMKMSGGGNDFVVLDNRSGTLPSDTGALAGRLCRRKFSIGADGLLVLEKDAEADFRMIYSNSDGSRAGMCGNGARCLARFAALKGMAGNKLRFRSDAWMHEASVDGEMVRLSMSQPRDPRIDLNLALDEENVLCVSTIHTGVPHAVMVVDHVDKIDVPGLGGKIRTHKDFAPHGTNVNFVQKQDEHRLLVRTYERGVEDETLACGTGVTASVLICALKNIVSSPVSCLTKGGGTLVVHFRLDKDQKRSRFGEVILEGPATVSFEGEVEVPENV